MYRTYTVPIHRTYTVHTQEDTSIEEVLCWIPSLSRFDDDEVTKVINIVVEAKEKLFSSV
jgi:hypothetical protein